MPFQHRDARGVELRLGRAGAVDRRQRLHAARDGQPPSPDRPVRRYVRRRQPCSAAAREIAIDVEYGVAVELETGYASLHHGQPFTPRDPTAPTTAASAWRIRYITPLMRQRTSKRWMVRLACGSDRYGHLDLADPPRGRLHEADFVLSRHDVAARRRQFYAGADLPAPDPARQAVTANHTDRRH